MEKMNKQTERDGATRRGSGRAGWPGLIAPAILVVAAVVRIVFLFQLSGSDLGKILPLDMRFYHDLGSTLAAGSGLPQGGLTFNPLYPVFLASVFRIFGDGLLAPRIIQVISGLVTIWLVFVSARLLAGGGKRAGRQGNARGSLTEDVRGDIAGITAAVLVLLYPQLLLYEGSLLATSLVTLIMAASFYTALSLSRALREGVGMKPGRRTLPAAAAAVLLGLLIGAGILGRPNIFLFLAPLLPAWLSAVSAKGRKRWKLPLLYAAGVVVMLAPASIYNASRTGTPAPVTSHGGINFYIGNMKGARGLYNPPEGMRRDMRGLIEDSRIAAERATGRKMTAADVSAYWSERARERIVTDTGGWLHLLGRKFLLFWNGGELGDIVDIVLMREECPVFRLLVIRFAILSTLAFAGAVLVIRHSSGKWPFMIFLASSLAGIVLFYFNTRYRLPSVPVLAASAGYLTAWTVGKISARRWKDVAVVAVVAVLFFAFVAGKKMFGVNRSATYTFLGNHYIDEGRDDMAMKAFSEALRLDPDSVENRINFARVLSRTGEKERAREYYELAWEAAPDFPRLALEYGYLLDELGMRIEARTLYNHAWNSGRRREMIVAAKLLSRMAYAEGRGDAAIMWIRKALELVPGDKELLQLLQRIEGS
jgi:Tfp pilus assembly protein PilF